MIPITKSRLSLWASEPSRLAQHQSTKNPPSTADYVIVGSGFSGASLAYHLSCQHPKAKIVLLEARDACSGATGRNGGHLVPEYIKHGQFEKRNYDAIYQLITEHNIDCWTNEKGERGWLILKSLKEYQDANRALEHNDYDLRLYTAQQAARKLGLESYNDIHGALNIPSSPINPYRLVNWLLERSIAHGVDFYTHSEVIDIDDRTAGKVGVTVKGKGQITADKVILATNGFTNLLSIPRLPEIKPVRGQVVRFEVDEKSLKVPLTNGKVSIGWGDEYLAVVPTKTPGKVSVVLGGLRKTVPGYEVGQIDDNTVNPEISGKLLQFAKDRFGINAAPVEEWTGIMGFPQTGVPYVGQIRGYNGGLYIMGGFEGHGMTRIYETARALSENMETGSWPSWFPEQYQYTAHPPSKI
uniref:ARAD1A02464p n=1 Tax=Blastobotrys adeninivorans TaxID=409370 RepID=A0A060SWN1_BLAAD